MTPEQERALHDKLDAIILDFRLMRHEVHRLRDRVAALESQPPPPESNGQAAE